MCFSFTKQRHYKRELFEIYTFFFIKAEALMQQQSLERGVPLKT